MMRILRAIAAIFGYCDHDYTFPQTHNGRTTVTCLRCSKWAYYDFNAMRIYDPSRTVVR